MKDLSAISKYWCSYTHKKFLEADLVGSEHAVLMSLSLDDYVTQDAISSHLVLDKGTIAKTLAKLEEKELVNRIVNNKNKREKIVSLTEKGKSEVQKVYDIAKQWDTSIWKGISVEEQSVFLAVLAKITDRAKILADQEKGN
ncbi:winged helix DNA-binding protein [uncultured Sphaerochaeta sp.]|uniref:MarR family winged helix-turn-helix transcriptional regulator n=1 Tax=uncultured Sphaerochaeta sp. TaxID=886478 RepID=UPI002A0A4F72|nr:winged helix DNA-binding protein [uncultured Sphaerochaeta sp.]